jgi:hypothetical protein
MAWEAPKKLREMLDRTGGLDPKILPETSGVYVFSLGPWKHAPANLLYLGSSHNLLERTGNNVACALGFWSNTVGQGQGWKLSEYCRQQRENPLDLYFGWLVLSKSICPIPCEKKLHARHYHKLSPQLLNGPRVNTCGAETCRKRECLDIANGSSTSCTNCSS